MLGRARRCVLVGRPRSGKSAIWLAIVAREPGDTVVVASGTQRPLRLATADISRRYAVAGAAPQPVGVRLAACTLLGHRPWIIDTPSLPDSEAPVPGTGQQAAVTLGLMLDADAVFHVWDAAAMGRPGPTEAPLDDELARWGRGRRGYWILAAKMDADWAQTGFLRIGERYPDVKLIPVAAATGRGLQALRRAITTTLRAR